MQLQQVIESRTAKLGVIGLGYVGLPLAALFADKGFDVVGVDINAARTDRIAKGECPIEGDEPGLPEMIARVATKRTLRATTSYADLADRDVIFINVDTPVEADHKPAYHALRSACESLGRVMKDGALVIIESTVAPGTLSGLVAPALAQSSKRALNQGFFLGHCPERVMPGRLLRNLRELARACGGSTPATAHAMALLYRNIVEGELDETDCVTAELVKTAENTYRDINIAFANELALICERAGGDFLKVRSLVNKSPGRNVLLAGAGVGGHCITKDPWLLAHGAPDMRSLVIEGARARNEGMPAHMLALTEQALLSRNVTLSGSTLAVLGFSYLEDSDDTRNSPSEVFIKAARAKGATVRIHDPWVAEYKGELATLLRGADCAIVLVAHSAYKSIKLRELTAAMKHPIVVDGRHVYTQADTTGVTYASLGRAFGLPSGNE
jgi:UDP-N-acetyl-D-mannosaminuronic acid dehydrogenase